MQRLQDCTGDLFICCIDPDSREKQYFQFQALEDPALFFYGGNSAKCYQRDGCEIGLAEVPNEVLKQFNKIGVDGSMVVALRVVARQVSFRFVGTVLAAAREEGFRVEKREGCLTPYLLDLAPAPVHAASMS